MSDCIQGVIDSLLDGCFGLEDAASDCAAVVLQQRQQLEDYREEVRELKAQLAETQALLPKWHAADFGSSARSARSVGHVRAFPEWRQDAYYIRNRIMAREMGLLDGRD